MKKVQAQRKFAQGATACFAVGTTAVQPERRTVEATPEKVKVITNDLSASKLLDKVSFAHPGMHKHYARVVLQRLPSPDKFASSVSSVSSVAHNSHTAKTYRTSSENASTRVLRSMCASSESEDDRPLTHIIKNNRRQKKVPRKSDAHKPVAKQMASESHKRRMKVETNGPGTSRNSRRRNVGISEPVTHIPEAQQTAPKNVAEPVAQIPAAKQTTSGNKPVAQIPAAKQTTSGNGRKRGAKVETNGPGATNTRSRSTTNVKVSGATNTRSRSKNKDKISGATNTRSRSTTNVKISEPVAQISAAKPTASGNGRKRKREDEIKLPDSVAHRHAAKKKTSKNESVAQIPTTKRTASENGKETVAQIPTTKRTASENGKETVAQIPTTKRTASENGKETVAQIPTTKRTASENGKETVAQIPTTKRTASENGKETVAQIPTTKQRASKNGKDSVVSKNEPVASYLAAEQTRSENAPPPVATCLAAEQTISENEPVASCLAAEQTTSENEPLTHSAEIKIDESELFENDDDEPDDDYRDYRRMEDEEYDADAFTREESSSPDNLVLTEDPVCDIKPDCDPYAFEEFNDNSIPSWGNNPKEKTGFAENVMPVVSGDFSMAEPSNANAFTSVVASTSAGQQASQMDVESPSADLHGSITDMPTTSAPLCFNEAPVYRPTAEEFTDPLKYYMKIAPEASKYGLCKVVAPEEFEPKCCLNNLDKLDAHHQYLARMFKRWGESTRFLSAVYACLTSHGVKLPNLPLVNGIEINLPKLFRVVQKYGGFNEVTRKQRWPRVASELNLADIKTPDKILDNIYLKFLLPYDILNERERLTINGKAEDVRLKYYEKILKRARNPLHLKKVYTGESDASGSEDDEPSEEVKYMRKRALELEECVGPGRKISLKRLTQVDSNAKKILLSNPDATVEQIESTYWDIVLQGADHVCVYSVSVDTSSADVGFPTSATDPISNHPWNLKNIVKNDNNILRSLGAVVSMTAPILHVGMFFTTNCWYKDPHGLPWVEYHHSGTEKIWYGIPKDDATKFRAAVEELCPTAAQKKKIWLPSDIVMIPPKLLLEKEIKLTRTFQKPGEYVFIFPESYTSSICTGLTITESAYFAVEPWLNSLQKVFQELRESCEPMTFAPEQLLIALSRDHRVPLTVLQQVFPSLHSTVEEELASRYALMDRGLVEIFVGQNPNKPWNVSEAVECDVCRRPLFLSKVTGKFHHPHLNQTCPQDAKQIMEKFEIQSNLVLEILVSEAELREIVAIVRDKLLTVNSSTN